MNNNINNNKNKIYYYWAGGYSTISLGGMVLTSNGLQPRTLANGRVRLVHMSKHTCTLQSMLMSVDMSKHTCAL